MLPEAVNSVSDVQRDYDQCITRLRCFVSKVQTKDNKILSGKISGKSPRKLSPLQIVQQEQLRVLVYKYVGIEPPISK